MANGKDITNELKEISPTLARLDVLLPYRVPAGYFDNLAELILLRIRAEEAGSAKEELELISPFLSGLNKKMPFSTPEGYFENLVPDIRKKEKEEQKGGRVVSFSPARRVFRLAAAAVTIGVVVLAAWFLINKPVETNNQYALNSDSAVQKDLKKDVSGLSEKEIANFIDGSSAIFNLETSGTGAEINDEDVKLMLADVSDQELERYLEQENTQKEKFN
jgi:hypothetical protein